MVGDRRSAQEGGTCFVVSTLLTIGVVTRHQNTHKNTRDVFGGFFNVNRNHLIQYVHIYNMLGMPLDWDLRERLTKKSRFELRRTSARATREFHKSEAKPRVV